MVDKNSRAPVMVFTIDDDAIFAQKTVMSECPVQQLRNGKKRAANTGSNWIGLALLFFRHLFVLW